MPHNLQSRNITIMFFLAPKSKRCHYTTEICFCLRDSKNYSMVESFFNGKLSLKDNERRTRDGFGTT